MKTPRIGSIWRYYKGDVYRVIATAYGEKSQETMVVFTRADLEDGDVRCCTVSEWFSLRHQGTELEQRNFSPVVFADRDHAEVIGGKETIEHVPKYAKDLFEQLEELSFKLDKIAEASARILGNQLEAREAAKLTTGEPE